MKVTYTMLRKEDTWGLRVIEGTVQAGDEVIATKRDGSTAKEVIDQIVWEGEDKDGVAVQLCTKLPWGGKGAPAPREERHATPTATPPRFVQRQAGEDELDDDIPF